MATVIPSRFALKSLHEEIDLFDRKLAHAENFTTFETSKDREAAVGKLTTKRQQLVRTAQSMIDEGIEFKPSEVPKSLRPAPEEAQS